MTIRPLAAEALAVHGTGDGRTVAAGDADARSSRRRPSVRRPRTPRMPRIDELPMPAQNELRQQSGELQEETPGEAPPHAAPAPCCSGTGPSGRRRKRARSRCLPAPPPRRPSSACRPCRRPLYGFRKIGRSRSRNMPAAPPPRASTSTAGRLLYTSLWMKINWKSQLSFAARPTKRARPGQRHGPLPKGVGLLSSQDASGRHSSVKPLIYLNVLRSHTAALRQDR